jgi:transcription initiation factor TFIIB
MEKNFLKTKKVKKTNIDRKALWNVFDTEVLKNKEPIECVYRSSGEREFCELCDGNLAFSEDGFLTCSNSKCGIIYKDILEGGAEWRFYGADDSHGTDPTRCGMPINPLLKESSYGCKVICAPCTSYEMRKIRRYTEWQSMPYKEKSQYDEFQRITMMAHNAGISKLIIDDAVRFHKKVSEQKTFRGINRDGIIAASIYVSFKVNDNPRTAKEIANVFMLDSGSATRGCKNAMSILNELEEFYHNDDKTSYKATSPDTFIERYCSKLQMNQELTKLCHFIALRIEKNNLIPENTPHSVAAGIVYFVAQMCRLSINKSDVNTISEISEVTINKCYKKLDSMRDTLIPSSIVKKYIK